MTDHIPPQQLDPTPLDSELASMTDTILENRSVRATSDEARELEPVLRNLEAFFRQDVPSDAFRARLTQKLDQEWAARQRNRRGRTLVLTPTARLAAAAAAVVLVIGVIALLSTGPTVDNGLNATTVGESNALGVFLIIGAVVGISAIALFIWRGRK